MTAREILDRAREAGLTLRRVGSDTLRVKPAGRVTPELRAELLAHKPELLGMLEPTVAVALGGCSAPCDPIRADDVATVTLTEFNRLRLVAEVRSHALGETVIFAADEATLDPAETRAVYRVRELLQLIQAQPDPETLQQIHATKVMFSGEVVV